METDRHREVTMEEGLGTTELQEDRPNSAAGKKEVPGRAFQGKFYLNCNLKNE